METNKTFLSVEKVKRLSEEFGIRLDEICQNYDLFYFHQKGNEDYVKVGNAELNRDEDYVNLFIPALTAVQLYDLLPLEIYTEDNGKCALNINSDIINDTEEFIVSYDYLSDAYPYITFSDENLVNALFDAISWCHENKHLQDDVYKTYLISNTNE